MFFFSLHHAPATHCCYCSENILAVAEDIQQCANKAKAKQKAKQASKHASNKYAAAVGNFCVNINIFLFSIFLFSIRQLSVSDMV